MYNIVLIHMDIVKIFTRLYFVVAQPNCILCYVQCRLLFFEWVVVQLTGYFLTSHCQSCRQLAFNQMSLLLPVCTHIILSSALISCLCYQHIFIKCNF